MNFGGAIGFLVVGMMMLAALFLIVYGATSGKQELVTVGVGIGGPILGAVSNKYFPNIVEAIKRLR